jgi:prepilin-type N-terminal cleavage/methylation domain-containing protein
MNKGFSLVELLMVIVIIFVFVGLTFALLFSRKSKTTLDLTTKQIVAFLREAQNRSIAQEKDANWGVVFVNNTSTPSFYGIFYSSTSTLVKKNNLPDEIKYSSSTIPEGSYFAITFNKITGAPSTSTIIYLYSTPSSQITSSISINISGIIDYNFSN